MRQFRKLSWLFDRFQRQLGRLLTSHAPLTIPFHILEALFPETFAQSALGLGPENADTAFDLALPIDFSLLQI